MILTVVGAEAAVVLADLPDDPQALRTRARAEPAIPAVMTARFMTAPLFLDEVGKGVGLAKD
jgi:hypothetical protein